MPIYEYRCGKCGFQKEFLQRMSDAPLTGCPTCGKRSFRKMVTAAGFHLKGTGWYATDFKGGGAKPAAKQDKVETKAEAKPEAKPEAKTEAKPDAKKPESKTDKSADSSGKKSAATGTAVPVGNN